MTYTTSTVTARLARNIELRKMYTHSCLMPTRQSATPVIIKTTPAMPMAGVIFGLIGNSSGREVEIGLAVADAIVDDGTTDETDSTIVLEAVGEDGTVDCLVDCD